MIPSNIFSPGGPAARQIAAFGWLTLILFSVITLVMWLLILWVSARRRGTLTEHLPWNARDTLAMRWIFVGGLAVPAIVLTVLFALSLRTMAAFPLDGGHDEHDEHRPPAIRVTGHQWWWEVQYLRSPEDQQVTTANEIHIPVGQPIDIELVSRDVIHSFWVPQLHGKVDLVPGMINRIRIQADRAGFYGGQCAEYCGTQHAHMGLLIAAEPAAQFERWLTEQRKPATPPVEQEAGLGEQLFMDHQCSLCHTVRGTDAHGQVGPDLTHIGSRHRLAANAFPNDTAHLAAWVTHAQSLKPGSQMPSLTAFDGEQLRALVRYLQELH